MQLSATKKIIMKHISLVMLYSRWVHEQAKEPQYKAATKTRVWHAPQAIGDNIHVREV
jgi:hypothetical protein